MVTDINSMNRQELIELKGINKEIAAAIVVRRRVSPFTDLSDLTEIRGISEKRLEQLKAQGVVCNPDPAQTKEFSCCSCGRTLPEAERNLNCIWYSNICNTCCSNLFYQLNPGGTLDR